MMKIENFQHTENLRFSSMKKIIIFLAIISLFLVGCEQNGQTVSIESPFIGGTGGIKFDFVEVREEVYDSGTDPFDITLKIENTGETDIQKDNLRITLSGINPIEFSATENDLVTTPKEDILANKKDSLGNIQPGPPVFVDFSGLNYAGSITGTSVEFPLRVNMCYLYNTKTISKLCIRKNILTATEGICNINEDKSVFNSGSPLQVTRLTENARAKDKIGFSFELRNMGTGDVYERGTVCDKTTRKNKEKVFVRVDTNMPGIHCTGLDNKGTKAEGYTTLFDGVKTITCTQPIESRLDFEQILTIEAFYDYEEYKQTKIKVRTAGE